jgi:L-alanine-DL-glutamate epimerase-like enolase superfamily enzyme
MDKKIEKIISINSKILAGSFGEGKYFGYKKKKLISLVEIKAENNLVGYGESLVGTYSPSLYELNLNYLKKFFLKRNFYESLEIIKDLQINKFFYNSGLLKSILASIEIAIINLIAYKKKEFLAQSINRIYCSSTCKIKNLIKVYSSAGSIRSNLNDLNKDIDKSIFLGIDTIKIRLDTSKYYKNKILLLNNKKIKFSIDLISNTLEKNRNQKNLIKFLNYIKLNKPLWIEEILNVNDLQFFFKIKKKFKKINFSYGENFNSFFDFCNLSKFYKFEYLNIDVCHVTIFEIIEVIKFIKKEKLKTKIILHCWGGIINLHTSLELASIFNKEIAMVELPIVNFTLNNNYIKNIKILDSKVDLNSVDRKNINKFYQNQMKKKITQNLKKYEFNFKK